MLVVKSLILAVSFLTQVAVLAAPIPLDARALLLKDDAIFSRADPPPSDRRHSIQHIMHGEPSTSGAPGLPAPNSQAPVLNPQHPQHDNTGLPAPNSQAPVASSSSPASGPTQRKRRRQRPEPPSEDHGLTPSGHIYDSRRKIGKMEPMETLESGYSATLFESEQGHGADVPSPEEVQSRRKERAREANARWRENNRVLREEYKKQLEALPQSAGESGSSQVPQHPPIPKMKKKCNLCTERNRYCDSGKPVCGRCIDDKAECIYSAAKSAGRKASLLRP